MFYIQIQILKTITKMYGYNRLHSLIYLEMCDSSSLW